MLSMLDFPRDQGITPEGRPTILLPQAEPAEVSSMKAGGAPAPLQHDIVQVCNTHHAVTSITCLGYKYYKIMSNH